MYRPSLPFTTYAKVLKGTYEKINGVNVKTYEEAFALFVSARAYGGTEKVINDKYIIEDTLKIETWYTPALSSADLLEINGERWEILNTPENIDMMNQFLVFKVRRVKGGA